MFIDQIWFKNFYTETGKFSLRLELFIIKGSDSITNAAILPTRRKHRPDQPRLDTLDGFLTKIRRYSSFRAYHDSGYWDENQMIYDSRLVGRSVWNSSWVLIIPGGTLHYDPDYGLDVFVQTVKDIKLFFQTYAISGM
ncbi:MAG: hypothetical protein OMM_08198 [Candidatus Magnetoglobus multicellularis str. Araruama]|uniref:Uncharacterized protein n=1 Tax=Candidatus Magnetoglobus multicellularis str. Araruama TaxID=890399 RepID=A0A1V1P974_9BACT|nr:MAG: hypothetical protein OMM_08198 [Candidatus Magnetoglobus multicellularis str. Araruama]